MPVNLLAYGGTAFVLRSQVGKWPANLEGALQDLTTLPDTAPTFGAGRFDSRCFLIVRQRQNVSDRGGYAFTLLLEPDPEIWRQWGWNAPRLLDALFGAGDGPARALLTNPESFGAAELHALFSQLRAPDTSRQGSALAARLQPLWVRGAIESSPAFYLASSLGLPSRPPLTLLADAVDDLPLCFRYGGGFLVGGNISQAKVWGAASVFDTDVPSGARAEEPPSEFLIWRSWQRVASDAKLGTALSPWASAPLWTWAEDREAVLGRVAKLAAVVDAAPPDDGLEALCAESWREGPLANVIHACVTSAVLREQGEFTASATRYLLARVFDAGLEIGLAVGERLDAVTVEEELRRRQREVWALPPGLNLSPEKRCEVAGVACAVAAPERVPLILSGVVGAWEDLRAELLKQLAADAAARISAGSLSAWRQHRFDFDSRLWPSLTEALSRAALPGARDGTGWALDYLLFRAPKSGFEGLSAAGSEDAVQIADALGKLLDCVGAERELGAEWLTRLAQSALRATLPLERKRKLAKRDGIDGAWQSFLALDCLFAGRRVASPPKPDAAEQVRLRIDLAQMAAQAELPSAPRLGEILDNLVDTPDIDTVAVLGRLEPPSGDSSAFADWVRGLQRLDAGNALKEWARSSVPAGDEPAEDVQTKFAFVLFGQDDKNQRPAEGDAGPIGSPAHSARVRGGPSVRLCLEHLKPSNEEHEQGVRGRLQELLKQPSKAVQEALSRAVNNADSEAGSVFAARYGAWRPLLDLLMLHLKTGEQQQLISYLEQHCGDIFGEDCLRLVRIALYPDTNASDTPAYDLALLRYLLEEKNRRTANQIAAANVLRLSKFVEALENLAKGLQDKGSNS